LAHCCTPGLARASTGARWSTERPTRPRQTPKSRGVSLPSGVNRGQHPKRAVERCLSSRARLFHDVPQHLAARCLTACKRAPAPGRRTSGPRDAGGLGDRRMARSGTGHRRIPSSPATPGRALDKPRCQQEDRRGSRLGPDAHLGASIASGPVFTVRRSHRGARARSSFSCWRR
jgi:hypothetical protein